MSSTVPSVDPKQITDSQLSKLSVQAGTSLPIRRGKDLGLPKSKPIFDMEELKQRNNLTTEARARQRIEQFSGRPGN